MAYAPPRQGDTLLALGEDDIAFDLSSSPTTATGMRPYEGIQPFGTVTAKESAAVTGNLSSFEGRSSGNGPDVLDTLNEPVMETIKRDLNGIWTKVRQVLLPASGGQQNILRDWDLWGPLLLCLALSIRLSLTAKEGQSQVVFTTMFVLVWIGSTVVTINTKLLGGKMSFFQSVCVLGYCIFPLVAASFACMFLHLILRVPLVAAAFGWSVWSSLAFLNDINLGKRRMLAVYPMCLFYFVIGWMILISKSII